jgi:hypothetical protein
VIESLDVIFDEHNNKFVPVDTTTQPPFVILDFNLSPFYINSPVFPPPQSNPILPQSQSNILNDSEYLMIIL